MRNGAIGRCCPPSLRIRTRVWLILVLMLPATAWAQWLDDPPTIVEADDSLTEEQNDHVEALALFAHGRVLLQRGLQLDGSDRREEFAAALRRFQRAWWFDHALVSVLEDIVPLTFELDREFEATRYLILAAEKEEVPVELLERVAAELADLEDFDQEQNERALKLYLKLRQRQGDAVSAITQFQIGRLSLMTGKFAEAADAFAVVQKALDENDSQQVPEGLRDRLLRRPEAIYALFGESYLRAKRLDEAEAAFRRADQGKPDQAALAFRRALIENERGNRDKALQLLQTYFDAKTESAGLAPYVLLRELIDGPPAREEADAKSSGTAAEPGAEQEEPQGWVPSDALLGKLKSLAEADPNNALLGYYYADALRRAAKWDQAVALYEKLLKQEPAVDGHQGLVEIYRQRKQILPLLTQLGAAVSEIGSLDALDTLTDEIAGDRQLLDQLAAQADAMLAEADQTPPEGSLLALALLLAAAERHDESLRFYNEGLKKPITTIGQASVNLAFAMFQADQPQLAARVFRRILDEKLLPDRTAEVCFYLAGAHSLAKDYDKALVAAREAARLEPNLARMQAREPWVLFQAKRLDEARQKYIELIDKFDSDHGSLENREVMRDVRLALSAVEVELGNLDAAEQWLQQILDEFPEYVGAFNDLGYLWTDQGKHLHRSLRMIQQAVEEEPDNVAYLDSLGWALYRLGRFDEALAPLEKAAATGDVDGVILEHLGDVYAKLGRTSKAVETWRQAAAALRQREDTKRVREVEAKLKAHTAPESN